jgi:hypothetical protein
VEFWVKALMIIRLEVRPRKVNAHRKEGQGTQYLNSHSVLFF